MVLALQIVITVYLVFAVVVGLCNLVTKNNKDHLIVLILFSLVQWALFFVILCFVWNWFNF